MMWSEISRSSEIPRGQREEFSPSSRTKRRGDAASALAGIQATDTQASRPSSCFRVSSVASSEAAGPASKRLAPDGQRATRQKGVADLVGSGMPLASRSTIARSAGV